MVRMHEENEIHVCRSCGLTLRVTFAAVPIIPLECCGIEMDFVSTQEDDEGLDLSETEKPEGALDKVYKAGEFYGCDICGIEVKILRTAQPTYQLDCCGEGMDLITYKK